MTYPWSFLKYWKCGEWDVVKEKLHDLEAQGLHVCPNRKNVFRALSLVPFERVRVAIIGQDPYPTIGTGTGVAFSVPPGHRIPLTLRNIFLEYCSDLHYPQPKSGDLEPWCKQGVLLMNAIPTCTAGQPGSHRWPEWELLGQEIVSELDARGDVVFVSLGSIAHSLLSSVTSSPVIHTSHPSPLGVGKGRTPFSGSRIFSRINSELVKLGQEPINWRL